MRKVFLLSLVFILLAALPAVGQCVGGSCRLPAADVRVKEKEKIKLKQPTPAWRYERAVGHRTAVVRVVCDDGRGARSIGSGVLVRWNKRVVVLTARHVVRDAKKIFIHFHNRKSVSARVLVVDATWDCAVLELDDRPEGVGPAEVELGERAMFRPGDRLESCGYGPDGKLAVNSGLFQGYRRSTAAMQGPDDWMVISGMARGGDSGGPIFNSSGKVVGVLWGTDGAEVVGVQAGRLHVLLDQAVARSYQQKQLVERRPTPPMAAPLEAVGGRLEAGERIITPNLQPKASSLKPMLPWRDGAQRRDQSQRVAIEGLIELERLRQADRYSRPPIIEMPSAAQSAPPAKPNAVSPSPLLAGLCVLAGVLGGFIIYFANEKGN
jgi:hypothetical protein